MGPVHFFDLASQQARRLADPSAPDAVPVKEASAWEVTHSGNSVSLEQELLKSGEDTSMASLNRAVVKAFNQMRDCVLLRKI